MDDNTLQQRIKYLVEHGGLWDDPIADLRRQIRIAIGLGTVAIAIEVLQLLV